MEGGDRVTRLLAALATRLRNPLQLRLFVCGSLMAAWYFAVYSPLGAGIDEAVAARERAERHLDLARAVEALRDQDEAIGGRLAGKTEPNEWIAYLLDGVRKFPVRLAKLEPKPTLKHGPFEVVMLRMEVQGGFADVDALLNWIEKNERLFRIDELQIQPSRQRHGGGEVTVQLSVLGLMG